jgi:hypothetical protein
MSSRPVSRLSRQPDTEPSWQLTTKVNYIAFVLLDAQITKAAWYPQRELATCINTRQR